MRIAADRESLKIAQLPGCNRDLLAGDIAWLHQSTG
jgi:hypothetical protein